MTCFPPSSFLVLVHRAAELIELSAAEFNLGSSLRIAAALATSRKGGNKHSGKGGCALKARPFVGKYTGKIPSINVSVKQALERAGRNNRSYFDIRAEQYSSIDQGRRSIIHSGRPLLPPAGFLDRASKARKRP